MTATTLHGKLLLWHTSNTMPGEASKRFPQYMCFYVGVLEYAARECISFSSVVVVTRFFHITHILNAPECVEEWRVSVWCGE